MSRYHLGQLEGRGDVECGQQFSESGVTVINVGVTVGNGRGHGKNDRSHGEMTIFGGPDQALSQI